MHPGLNCSYVIIKAIFFFFFFVIQCLLTDAATSCHPGAIHSTAQLSGSFVSNNSDMAGGHTEAERLQQSAKDPGNHKDRNEEEEVERSYRENSAGNAQAAVENLMSNMEFLQRESDLIYIIPKGDQARMQCREPLGLELPRRVASTPPSSHFLPMCVC